MKRGTSILILVAVFLLQPFFGALVPALGLPDAVMCIMVAGLTFCSEEEYVPLVVTGSILELLKDLATSLYIGTGVISVIAAVFVALLMRHRIAVERIPGAVIMAALAALAKQVTLWIVLIITGTHVSLLYVLEASWTIVLADTLLTAVICFFAGRNRKHSDIGNGFFV